MPAYPSILNGGSDEPLQRVVAPNTFAQSAAQIRHEEASGLAYILRAVETSGAMDLLLTERRQLIVRIEQEREQHQRLEWIIADLADRLAHDERMLGEIDSVLGHSSQLRLDDADVRLRGQRLERVAIEILDRERGRGEDVHYREWFELLRLNGYVVAGKNPVNTFLAQINRSNAVERVGRRTGLYRLPTAA